MTTPTVIPVAAGTYSLGPSDGKLTVKTSKSGAAAKAGRNLLIEVTSWRATLRVGEDLSETAIELSADGRSLKVVEGSGGIQALTGDDKASIEKTIDDDVLKRSMIEFRSTAVQPGSDGATIGVSGELEMLGKRAPFTFELEAAGDGRLRACAEVKQTALGIKPYSALFGALKVVDEVQVAIDVQLPSG